MTGEDAHAPENQVRLSRKDFIGALGGAGVALGGLEPLLTRIGTAEAQGNGTQYLVILTLDAFRYDYQSLVPMPHLQSLIHAGTQYDRAWVGQLQSETPAGHATIGTGVFPRRHGILGFEWRSGATKQTVLDGWPPEVMEGLLDRDLRQANTNSVTQSVKAVNSGASVVAVSSEKVYAADAMGGWAADHILYHLRDKEHHTLVPKNLRGHRSLPAGFLSTPQLTVHLPIKHFTDWDYISSITAVRAVQDLHPRVLMVNLPGADVYGHPYGGPASPAIMSLIAAGVDRSIGRILAAYRKAGIFDRTLFLVVADHGMVPNAHAVSTDATDRAVARAKAHLLFQTGGTAKFIYLKDPVRAPQVAQEMERVHHVIAAYHLVPSSTGYSYQRAGVKTVDSALEAAHQYLLGTFIGPRAPDVVAAFRENTIGRDIKTLYGYHGGLNWGAHHIPLVLSGPGVATGRTSHFPARLVDVAPTVLRLMGLPAAQMDGIVLADAVASPTSDETAAQAALAPSLTAGQGALIAQSEQNLAEDRKHGVKLKPSAPVHP